MLITFLLSMHATKKAKQRGISKCSINQVIKYGEESNSHDDIIYDVTPRTVKEAQKDGFDIKNLLGMRVVMTVTNYIKTVYRLRHP